MKGAHEKDFRFLPTLFQIETLAQQSSLKTSSLQDSLKI